MRGKTKAEKVEKEMNSNISCEYNMDTRCVELRMEGGTVIAIDCTVVENMVTDNMYQRSELDRLIYNDPLAYVDLVLNGEPDMYLKAVTEYQSMDT